jgi:ubiquinone/menaquinone biosynthesis C-methylase UbiE
MSRGDSGLSSSSDPRSVPHLPASQTPVPLLSSRSDWEAYLLSDWAQYEARPERLRATLTALAGRAVSQVLDVGCGAGQKLLSFVRELGAKGTGVDVSQEAVQLACRQFAALGYAGQADFRCCQAESLPFEAGSFDVILCRLALPYTRNDAALSEMARVLRPGGLLLLKIHHARFCLRGVWQALCAGHFYLVFFRARVLVAGTFYHVAGHQPDNCVLKREVFQTRWKLSRILSSLGLSIRGELPNSDSNPGTPTFIIEKGAGPLVPRQISKMPA